MNAYSLDLRERALAAVDRGMPRKEAVGVFGVSLATLLKRWLKRREQTGSAAAPKRKPGMRRRVGATLEERRAPCGPARRTSQPRAPMSFGT